MLILSGLIVSGIIGYGFWQVAMSHLGGEGIVVFGSLLLYWAWLVRDYLDEKTAGTPNREHSE